MVPATQPRCTLQAYAVRKRNHTCAGPGGVRSIGDALAQGSPGGPRLLVRVAAGVYRERLRVAIPVTIEAWPAVRPGMKLLQRGVSCRSFG